MKKNKYLFMLLVISASSLISGCAMFPSAEEKAAEKAAIIEEAVSRANESLSGTLDNYVSYSQYQADISTIDTTIQSKIDSINTLTEGQKEEVKQIVSQTFDEKNQALEDLKATEDEDSAEKDEEKKDKKTSKKESSKSSESSDTSNSGSINNELTAEMKKEIDKRVASQMATIISDAGIVVADGNTSGGTVSKEEKEAINANINTLFVNNNNIVKDLEALNKQVGDNKARIDILCSQVGSASNNNNNSNNNATLSDSEKNKLKTEIKNEVLIYIIRYLSTLYK